MRSSSLHKVIQVGNSLAVTIPSEFVKRHRLGPGKHVVSSTHDGEIRYRLSQDKSTEYQEISDPDFIQLIKQIESRYGKALKELARLP